MKERPIIFSGEMVRAIQKGSKTQTRRVIPNAFGAFWDHRGYKPVVGNGKIIHWEYVTTGEVFLTAPCLRCPYGIPGDRLWVREAFAPRYFDNGKPGYRADWTRIAAEYIKPPAWKSPIYMPRSASRITLEIVNVRVERLQQITYADALAEGVWRPGPEADPDKVDRQYDAIDEYKRLWGEIHKKPTYSWTWHTWESNPWVWVIEFRQVK